MAASLEFNASIRTRYLLQSSCLPRCKARGDPTIPVVVMRSRCEVNDVQVGDAAAASPEPSGKEPVAPFSALLVYRKRFVRQIRSILELRRVE